MSKKADAANRMAQAMERMASLFEKMAEKEKFAGVLREENEALLAEVEGLRKEVQRLGRVAREARSDRDDLWNQLQKPLG